MKTKRKSFFKSVIALTLALIMVLGAAPLSELAGVDWASFFAPKAEAAGKTYKVGDIVEFGYYPQSKVTDPSLISALDKVAKIWFSYGYYNGIDALTYGTMVRGDWMKYADLTYDGAKYRAVTFSQYRPRSTEEPSSSDNTYQVDNGYTINNIYYFKYEPLKWRIFDPSEGLVLCEDIIDSQAYSNTVYEYGTDESGTAYWNDAEHTHYANDYATSSIRAWLNDDFYNTAFSSSQKANILTSELDNTAGLGSLHEYDSETTYDKVFLPSDSEMRGTEDYPENKGFSSAPLAEGTDYAKCQGLGISSPNKYYLSQLLRSAGGSSILACRVYYRKGKVDPIALVNCTNYGIRPALRISNLESCARLNGGSFSERDIFIANMPKLSPDDAKQFLGFIYKTDFSKVDITDDIQYKLLTGDLYDTSLTVDEIKAYILAFCTVTERTINSYVEESMAVQNFTCSKLIERLQKELKGMKTPEQEFVLSYAGKLKDMVEDAFVGIMAGAVSKYTGIYITEQVLDNASGIIATIDSVDAVPGKIEKFYNKVYIGVDAIFFVISQELIGRYGFFNSYVSNRNWADSANDPAFRVLVDYNYIAYADSTLFSYAINLTTWITGKESWNKHRDDIERWAEFFWQLDQYQTAEEHHWTAERYAPSCTQNGYTRHVCATCGSEYIDSYVNAKGHNYGSTVVAPTCTDEGYTLFVCKTCGSSYKGNLVSPTGHKYERVIFVQPTCENRGYTLYKCSCGEQYYEYSAALGHKFSEKTVEPTEKTQGYTQYTCDVCGYKTYDNYKDPLGHSFETEVVAPTCESGGYTVHKCSLCNESYTDNETDALGHDYKRELKNQAACVKAGAVTLTCSRCAKSYDEEIPATGHSYQIEYKIEASCAEAGRIGYVCQCGDKYEEQTGEALGHDFALTEKTEGSCTEDAVSIYKCTRCSEGYESSAKAPGHTYGVDYDTVVEGDCTHSSYKIKKCTVCGCEKYFDISAAEGHKFSDWQTVTPATAESEGIQEHECTACGQKETQTIPKLDFVYGDVNGDGKINGRDVVKLAKYLAAYDELTGTSSVTVSPGADVNGDGRIDGRDLVKLRKYLANYDESTGQSSVKLGPER